VKNNLRVLHYNFIRRSLRRPKLSAIKESSAPGRRKRHYNFM
jgi:hypothetical protein